MRRIAHDCTARMAAIAALVTCAAVAGCTPNSTDEYTKALSQWESHQYSAALATAQSARESANKANDTQVRDQSAYLAGLAAYQLGKTDDATRSFAFASKSANKQVAGRATAMMGAVALEQGRWSDAATLYRQASQMLTGADADEARTYASAAEERGRGVRSPGAWRAPSASSGAAVSGSASMDSANSGGGISEGGDSGAANSSGKFTIIAGTFSSEVAARQRASTLIEPAKRAGMSAPKVSASTAPDRRVWVVEVGSFTDRAKAEAAMKKLPTADCVVAPVRN